MALNKQFGTGALYLDPVAGNIGKVGILHEVQLAAKATVKKLYGQKVYPVDSGVASRDVSGKAKMACLDVAFFAAAYFGVTPTTGMIVPVDGELITVPDTPGPYTCTVANAAHFEADFGVKNAAGKLLTAVAPAAEVAGVSYSVDQATGIYTFAAADKKVKYYATYTWKDTANGLTAVVSNTDAGESPLLRALLWNKHRGKSFGTDLYAVQLTDFQVASKQGDFWIVDIGFEAFCDDNDNLLALYGD